MAENIADKKAAIMKAALVLFTQRGFQGTPTSMISESAGVSTGTLFRCFATKKDLINSVYFSAKESMSRATSEGIEKESSIRGKIKCTWGNSIRWGVDHPFELMFIEQFSSSPFITDVTQEEAQKNFGFLFELLDEGIRAKALKNQDRDLAIYMMYSANVAVVKKILNYGAVKDINDIIDRSFDIVWNGIAR